MSPPQHLVTFSIGEEDDLGTVEDAVRKLSIMDTQGKIWAQEMLLQVNGSAVKLFDISSKVKERPRGALWGDSDGDPQEGNGIGFLARH